MSLENSQSKLRVAIIGGGMGGLVLALCLKKYGPEVHFDIYESASELTEVGAGIGVFPRIWTIIKELGIEDELLTIQGTQGRQGSGFWMRKGDEGSTMDVVEFPEFHTFHRSILQQLLANHLDAGDRIHFSKRLASYSETSSTEPITLNFKDGTTATCDLVVGSDGVRSAVRRTMFNEYADVAGTRGQAEEAARLREMVEPGFSGEVVYRGLAPASALSPELVDYSRVPQILLGKNGQITMYPVSGGDMINIAAVRYIPGSTTVYPGPWVENTPAETVAKLFEGWDPRGVGIIKAITSPFRWAMHTVRKLPTYVKGRAALVGDAAHAMLPHQGSGVGQAFEDGLVLAIILSHPAVTRANLPAALAIYDDVRRPYSQEVQEGSARNGMNYQLRRAGWEDVSVEDSKAGRYPRELLGVLGEELLKQTKWLFETSILDERAALLERIGALAA
ncbi:FAD/NAD(P)-binding domain-containing protein [Ganoderma leucocontextum]|nr:FAD/NAD(P)-binding domain-containing protein [Ganoderma leucocontextum]